MHIVGYVKVRLGLRRLNPPRQTALTEVVTSFSFKNLQSAEQAFQVFNSPGNTSRPGLQQRVAQWQTHQSCCVNSNTTK
jgi:hypothetical protein